MTVPVPVIAIDGPSASGKSSTAAAVARALGWPHVDSGALYRTLTWVALEHELDDPTEICARADLLRVRLVPVQGAVAVEVGGYPVGEEIRSDAVTAHVSAIAAMPPVREWVNARLREAVARAGGGVMDGRDIGTVVFPDAPLKVFLTASPEARAVRRLRQRDGGGDPDPAVVAREAAELAARDRRDAERAVAPLRQAADARFLDTTGMGFDEQVARILVWAGETGLRGAR